MQTRTPSLQRQATRHIRDISRPRETWRTLSQQRDIHSRQQTWCKASRGMRGIHGMLLMPEADIMLCVHDA